MVVVEVVVVLVAIVVVVWRMRAKRGNLLNPEREELGVPSDREIALPLIPLMRRGRQAPDVLGAWLVLY